MFSLFLFLGFHAAVDRHNMDKALSHHEPGFAQSFTHNHGELFFFAGFSARKLHKKLQVLKSGQFMLINNFFYVTIFVNELDVRVQKETFSNVKANCKKCKKPLTPRIKQVFANPVTSK
jgi:hypothetical protein